MATVETGTDLLDTGPGKIEAGFYNSEQVLNRDLTILILNQLKPKLFLDGFGATGIRGIRVSLETGTKVVISERSKESFKILSKNVELNKVDAELHWASFEEIVTKFDFDFIDVDPYGSILPYLDISLNNIRNDGCIGFTATDLSALSGSIPEKTLRRYGSIIPKSMMRHELGIRNLLGMIAKRAASLDMGMVPILAFWSHHYYRIFVRVKRGAKNADNTLKNVGTANLGDLLGKTYENLSAGPIWIGSIENIFNNGKFEISDEANITNHSKTMIDYLAHEDTSFLFMDLNEVFSRNHKDIPSIKKIIELGKENGFDNIYRTHFSPTGLKVKNLYQFSEIALRDIPTLAKASGLHVSTSDS
ncbi:MAG: tRNA (guanine(26)-N(2))-dimethyltransferase [Thermoplasmataceae archaeon]